MTTLITGASGLLGAHLATLLARTRDVAGMDRHEWWGSAPVEVSVGDLADTDFRHDVLRRTKPDVLVHCAAMVNVDLCEEQPEQAYRINSDLTGALAREVPDGCLVVYVTTDGIFRGEQPFAAESTLPCPRTTYGRSKLHGEWEVQLATRRHLILRTNFYGWSSGAKRTSGEWLYGELAAGNSITLFDDFFFTPVYVVHLAESLRVLIDGNHEGIFHVCGADRVSKYDFAAELAEAAGLSMANVRRGRIGDARLLAPRPKDMSLKSERLSEAGIQPVTCAAGVKAFVRDRGTALDERFHD